MRDEPKRSRRPSVVTEPDHAPRRIVTPDGIRVVDKNPNGAGSVYRQRDGRWCATWREDGKRRKATGPTRARAVARRTERMDKARLDGPHDRILWNRRDNEADIDEIVISYPDVVHVEQMDDRCWWIGIYRDDTFWMGNFVADSRGRMRFVEQDNHGIDWSDDDSHEEPR
jgi:hypothetical protein